MTGRQPVSLSSKNRLGKKGQWEAAARRRVT